MLSEKQTKKDIGTVGSTVFEVDRTEVKKIILGEGITEIKDYAFGWDENWKSLVEIQFPNTLTRIGDRAFEAIPSLKK